MEEKEKLVNRLEANGELVDQALKFLREHFDAVQIFICESDSDDQDAANFSVHGSGNLFARYGVIKQWILQQEESFRKGLGNEE